MSQCVFHQRLSHTLCHIYAHHRHQAINAIYYSLYHGDKWIVGFIPLKSILTELIFVTSIHLEEHPFVYCHHRYTVKPVYNDHLMGYFSVLWSSSRWPRATLMSSRRQKLLARVTRYLPFSLKHITELITSNESYYIGGRYKQVSLYTDAITSLSYRYSYTSKDISAPFY